MAAVSILARANSHITRKISQGDVGVHGAAGVAVLGLAAPAGCGEKGDLVHGAAQSVWEQTSGGGRRDEA